MIDHVRIAVLALAIVAIAVACTAGPGAQPPESVAGRQFLSTGVTVNGVERPLVAGTRIRLAFADGSISASVGCNSMSGSYTITAGQLLVGDLATTEMGCDAPRHEQDEWLAAFLGSKPTLRLAGHDLTLEADATVVRFLDREIAEPDLPLVGTRWALESIAQGDTVSSVRGSAPILEFLPDGRVTLTTGCNDGFARYSTAGSRLRVTDIGTTRKACAGDGGEIEQLVLAVLGAENLTFRIDDSLLKLESGERRLEYRGDTSTR